MRSYNTYDRFLGSWWGSILGQALVQQPADSSSSEHIFAQPWLLRRRQVAETLIESELRWSDANFVVDEQFVTQNGQQARVAKHYSNILSLLPLIIFCVSEQNLQPKITAEYNLKLAKLIPHNLVTPDILLWCYLLTTVLNSSSLNSKSASTVNMLDVATLVQDKQLLESPLGEKLILVSQGVKRGISLSSLREKLAAKNNLQATAIALSWYCFITTPQDFNLSIRRAALSGHNLAWLTTALTGTLSGAYNGMARISLTWRTRKEQQQNADLENHLFQKLFQSWSGVYAIEGNYAAHNSKLEAIALPQLIQFRPTLNIISQSPRQHQKFPSKHHHSSPTLRQN
ncbi:MAG: ADP-ribosylglycohydrolase family protein [Cyanobacteria bacterium P01_C01_bin.72]